MKNEIIPIENIQTRIFTIRGVQVMLDSDLASLYQTETRTLKQTVKRNIVRFPNDFMFELSNDDVNELVSQSVIPSKSYFGGAKPFVFIEQGVLELSRILKKIIDFTYLFKGKNQALAIIDNKLIASKIHILRGINVILDVDLAELYEVKAIRLREQVKRNSKRFPLDFMFQLNDDEIEFMVSQNAIPSN